MTSLAPRSLLRGSSRIGSSLYFKVKPALSWALSKVKNLFKINQIEKANNGILKYNNPLIELLKL